MKNAVLKYQGTSPQLSEGVFLAPGSRVIGSVRIGRDSSVFYNSVVRGDVNDIAIGEYTNIQDNCTLHVTNRSSLKVGDGVTVGHNAILHGCTVGDNVLVGMGAIILDDAVIAADSIVAAGSLVPPGKQYPAGSLIMGSPATVIRPLREDERERNRAAAEHYLKVKDNHLLELAGEISINPQNQ